MNWHYKNQCIEDGSKIESGTKDGSRALLLQATGLIVLIWLLLGFICVRNATAVALVQIAGDPAQYQSLQDAYNADLSGAQILARDLVFSEDLILDLPIDVHIEGGLSSDFATVDGYTTLEGILLLQSGSLIVDNLIIGGISPLPVALWPVEGAPASAQVNSTYSTSSAVTEITAATSSPAVDNASASATFTTDANGNPATLTASNFGEASLTSPVSLLSSGVSGLGASNFTSESTFNFGNQTSNGTIVVVHSIGGANVTGFNTTGLSYSDYGIWSLKPTGFPNPPYVGAYAVGNITPAMPSSGSKTFSGRAAGVDVLLSPDNNNHGYNFSGAISLTADFSTGSISGNITSINMYTGTSTNSTASGTINDLSLTGTISGTSFSGTVTASGTAGTLANTSGATGTFTGNFYGSSTAAAHEVALTLQIPSVNGSNLVLIGGAGAH